MDSSHNTETKPQALQPKKRSRESSISSASLMELSELEKEIYIALISTKGGWRYVVDKTKPGKSSKLVAIDAKELLQAAKEYAAEVHSSSSSSSDSED